VHWARVYQELLEFKEGLLAAARKGLQELPEEAVHREVAETDAKVLRAERDRLQRRLKFWRQKVREFSGSGVPAEESQGARRH
jgi:hypothetical protein